eukprot:TRINITY_DN14678_c0_g1_i16.p1 TRINITY_DN14678_c0_g1~~TRINITY_DN14678_c0_g1_i16.p1  ORF type:complete len:402 (+),score=114.95 TRINITY_DN14678_c0_g1_i16:96-1301(+)
MATSQAVIHNTESKDYDAFTKLVSTAKSMCEVCGDEGCTSVMATAVPFFKEISLVSFSCEGCGNRNAEVSFCGELPECGVRMECKVAECAHLNRIVVKSEYASIRIPELDLEIPARTQKGSMNSIEGMLSKMVAGLQEGQATRKDSDPQSYAKINDFIALAQSFATGAKLPFTLILDDPSGNSCIQNPYAPAEDPFNSVCRYARTREQLLEIGYNPEPITEKQEDDKSEDKGGESITAQGVDFSKPLTEKESEELAVIDIPCYACGEMGKNKMCVCQVPHFNNLITMCFECDKCGYKSTEVKSGGGLAEKGKRFSLAVKTPNDLARELYKADTCVICVPELGLEMETAAMGSFYTTLEGLLDKMYCSMKISNPFGSSQSPQGKKFAEFLDKLKGVRLMLPV